MARMVRVQVSLLLKGDRIAVPMDHDRTRMMDATVKRVYEEFAAVEYDGDRDVTHTIPNSRSVYRYGEPICTTDQPAAGRTERPKAAPALTGFMAQIKQRQADSAAQWLASTCQRYGVDAADVVASIGGDFEQYWTDWAPKDCMDVIGYWKPAVHQAAEALKIRKERKAVVAAREAHARKMGGCVCQRCQGAGGRDGWPGYTCFECGGTGYTKDAAR